jgi:hypothetical protein
MSKDWTKYPQICRVGKIPYYGDAYYDGVLDAHNRDFFITSAGETIHYGERNDYEEIFFAYRMDPILTHLLDTSYSDRNLYRGALMSARYYAENHLIAEGVLLERHLERGTR